MYFWAIVFNFLIRSNVTKSSLYGVDNNCIHCVCLSINNYDSLICTAFFKIFINLNSNNFNKVF